MRARYKIDRVLLLSKTMRVYVNVCTFMCVRAPAMNNACGAAQNQWRRWMRQQTFWFTHTHTGSSLSLTNSQKVLHIWCVCTRWECLPALKRARTYALEPSLHHIVCKLTHFAYFNKRTLCLRQLFICLIGCGRFGRALCFYLIHSAIGWRATLRV